MKGLLMACGALSAGPERWLLDFRQVLGLPSDLLIGLVPGEEYFPSILPERMNDLKAGV